MGAKDAWYIYFRCAKANLNSSGFVMVDVLYGSTFHYFLSRETISMCARYLMVWVISKVQLLRCPSVTEN